MKKIKISVIGFAEIAEKRIIPAIIEHPLFELVSIARQNYSRRQFSNIYEKYFVNDYSNVLNNNLVDLVYIPLPNNLHYEWVKKSLNSGKHVIVEKPMGLNLEEVQDLTELAKSKNLVLLENFQFRFHRQIKKIKDLINNNSIGNIRYANITYCIPPFKNKDNFRYNKLLGGGSFYDASCYPFKITQELFGDDFEVEHFKLLYVNEFDVDIAGYGTLFSKKHNLFCHIKFGFQNYYQNKIEIFGTNGYIKNFRIFTAHPDVNTQIYIGKNNSEELIETGCDNHFIGMLSYVHELVNSNSEKREFEQLQNYNLSKIMEQALKLSKNENTI